MSSQQSVRLFISHSHADNAFGVRLAEDLRHALGDVQSVWYDVSGGLHGGDAWWRKIVQEIAARPVFLVVLSPDAMESRWVNDEVDLAWNLKNTPEGKTIIPVLYRECQPRADLRTRHIISFVAPRSYETALSETLVALGVPGSTSAPRANLPATPSPSRSVAAMPGVSAQAAMVEQFAPQIEAAYMRRDWSDVMRKVELLLRRTPDHVTSAIYRMYGVALVEEGEAARARAALDSALALDPLDPAAMRAAARVSVALNDPETAHALLEDALAIASDNDLRLCLLADDAHTLRLAGRAAEEVRRCDEALRLVSGDAEWSARRVVALTLANRTADAQSEMEHLARDTASRASADAGLHVRAEIAALHGELTKEAQAFRQAKSLNARKAVAERFAALLTRNAAKTSSLNDPLSPVRQLLPRIPERLASLGYIMRPYGELEAILPPLCDVPAGRCLLSDGVGWAPGVAARDLPHQWVARSAFQIARSPVTVAEYACFVRSQRSEPQRWEGTGSQRLDWKTQLARPDHPVVCVTWHDALAYAAWLSALTGERWRLPTEGEWEKAARWDENAKAARTYPWGEQFDSKRCNCAGALSGTSPIGTYPDGASPCGALDMVGNVWEWTSNLAEDDTIATNASSEPAEIAVLRGGSWFSGLDEVSGVARRSREPNGYSPAIGFRLICLSR
ncbi:MAG TPA: SUMF1/EgtB/PvdO family nonheme iron enzyme [Ktedonobacterales bacterium]